MFRAGGITTPLTFATSDEAWAYVAQAAGEARVVLVTDGGSRQVVGPATV